MFIESQIIGILTNYIIELQKAEIKLKDNGVLIYLDMKKVMDT